MVLWNVTDLWLILFYFYYFFLVFIFFIVSFTYLYFCFLGTAILAGYGPMERYRFMVNTFLFLLFFFGFYFFYCFFYLLVLLFLRNGNFGGLWSYGTLQIYG